METTDGMAMTVCRMGFSNARTTESTLSSPGAGNAWRWSVMANNSTARTASRKISNGKQFLNGSVGDSSGSGATFSSGTQNVPCDRFFRGLKSLRFRRTAGSKIPVRLRPGRTKPRRKFSGWPPKSGNSGTRRDRRTEAWIVNRVSRGNLRPCLRRIRTGRLLCGVQPFRPSVPRWDHLGYARHTDSGRVESVNRESSFG